jgi:hypothetical protein
MDGQNSRIQLAGALRLTFPLSKMTLWLLVAALNPPTHQKVMGFVIPVG